MEICIWPYVIIYAYIHVYDHIWAYMIIHDHTWSFQITCDHMWLCIYNHTWSYLIIYDHVAHPFSHAPHLIHVNGCRRCAPVPDHYCWRHLCTHMLSPLYIISRELGKCLQDSSCPESIMEVHEYLQASNPDPAQSHSSVAGGLASGRRLAARVGHNSALWLA